MRLQTRPLEYPGGPLDVIRKMIKQEGMSSLYRGLLSPQAGFGITFAISFAGYGQGVRFFRERNDEKLDKNGKLLELSLGEMTAAGAWAGLLQSPARQIFERVKSVMQVQEAAGGKAPYKWSGECVVQLSKKEGLYHGLFRGLDATIARELPQFAIYYPIYELSVRALKKWNNKDNTGNSTHTNKASSSSSASLPPHLLLLAGGVAGTIQWLPPFYCIDVIKSRMQSALPGVYTSAWDCAKKSYQKEGLPVFFRGLPVALVRAFPLHACIFLGYETTLAALKDQDQEGDPPLPPAE